jgi:8-oxo-dGTP diphosphatase
MRFDEIDWQGWRSKQEATLLFVIRDGRILLIGKKRGLGAGKVNGPGGRVGDGETPLEAAVREVEEELGVTPLGASKVGEVLFQVVAGVAMRIHVFRASDLRGEPTETEEAVPLWTAIDDIPYARMWASDRHWYPLMLAGTAFEIRTLFDGDRLLGHELLTAPAR